ncbi:hypothetical protein [Prochlorococcus marinus]|uniref:DUF4878 domain-containing protein n=1 Tax=Prochlorococcus marinus (strain MIT 9303) TaxID=59922 RepID=A2CB52_PROM3|nr:hypothetical protein [Prochlorococcus marinus]ABM78712.1 Hypothetical protein P9303_19701 [Prochlorococcus marinus str. MIT 9303]
MTIKLSPPVKWVLVAFGSLSGLFIIVFSIVIQLTSGMTKTADKFLDELKVNNTEAALELFSAQAKNSLSRENIQRFSKKNSLNNYDSVSWSNRSISYPDRGELTGTINLKSGKKIPVVFNLNKDGSSWKIYSIKQDRPGIHNQSSSTETPSETNLIDLVNETTDAFINSISLGGFQNLYDYSSRTWQKQTTVKDLDKALSPFLKFTSDPKAINYLNLVTSQMPVFKKEPEITSNGTMTINGSYSLNPPFEFTYKYIYEGLGWKLIGVNVSIKS